MLNKPTNEKFSVVYGPKNARYIDLFAFSLEGLTLIAGSKVEVKQARSAVSKVLGADIATQIYGK
jgi:hypothetical protein